MMIKFRPPPTMTVTTMTLTLSVLFMTIVAAMGATPLPIIQVEGTHYTVGFQAGVARKHAIQNFTSHYPNLIQTLIPFVHNTPEGAQAFRSLITAVRSSFPQYLEELRGLAAGANVDEETLQILNLENELTTLLRISTSSASPSPRLNEDCSDVLMGNIRALAHNEDGYNEVGDGAYLLQAKIRDPAFNSHHAFTAYCYPGYVAGIAFGFSDAGLGFSCNAEFPQSVNLDGIGDAFLSRHVLASSSIDDAIARATSFPAANGHSFNIISFPPTTSDSAGREKHHVRVVNIEASANGTSVLPVEVESPSSIIKNGVLFHFNEYRHLPGVNQFIDTSSMERLAVASTLPLPDSQRSALAILGNHQNPRWPIYRNSHPPDYFSTLATAYFSTTNRTMSVWVRTNPSLSPPDLIFPIPSS